MMPIRKPSWIAVATAVATVFALMSTGHALFAGPTQAAPTDPAAAAAQRASTEQLLAYNDSIRLTADQEAVRREALEGLAAPCCAQFTAATCCCECNMARATWGLAKHLIADEGHDAERVRQEVADWYDEINPDGFSGRACFDGGCGRAFADDGCGGMDRNHPIF